MPWVLFWKGLLPNSQRACLLLKRIVPWPTHHSWDTTLVSQLLQSNTCNFRPVFLDSDCAAANLSHLPNSCKFAFLSATFTLSVVFAPPWRISAGYSPPKYIFNTNARHHLIVQTNTITSMLRATSRLSNIMASEQSKRDIVIIGASYFTLSPSKSCD